MIYHKRVVLVALLAAALIIPMGVADSSAASVSHGGGEGVCDDFKVIYIEDESSTVRYSLEVTVFNPPAENVNVTLYKDDGGDSRTISNVPFDGKNLYISLGKIPLQRGLYLVVLDTVSDKPIGTCEMNVKDYCTISFAAGAGSGTMDSVEVISGSEYVLPECGFKAPQGQSFKGWSIGVKEYNVGTAIIVSSDTVVQASWTTSASDDSDMTLYIVLASVILIILIIAVFVLVRRSSRSL